jgi:hypothetical protein
VATPGALLFAMLVSRAILLPAFAHLLAVLVDAKPAL